METYKAISDFLIDILARRGQYTNEQLVSRMMSEEGTESCNKLHRIIRTMHTRKTSKKNCLTDLFHYELYLSDPKMISIRLSGQKKIIRPLPPQVGYLLMREHEEFIQEETENEDIEIALENIFIDTAEENAEENAEEDVNDDESDDEEMQ